MTPHDEATFPATRWKGLVLEVTGGPRTEVQEETMQGNASFRPAEVGFLGSAELLGGRMRVERVPCMRRISGYDEEGDHPALAVDPEGRLWVAWISFDGAKDRVKLRHSANGVDWSEEQSVTPQGGEYHQVAVIAPRPGEVIVVWVGIEEGVVSLFTREFLKGRWSEVRRLTSGPGPDMFPRMTTARDGTVYLAWQSGADGSTDISLMIRTKDGWGRPLKITEHPASLGRQLYDGTHARPDVHPLGWKQAPLTRHLMGPMVLRIVTSGTG